MKSYRAGGEDREDNVLTTCAFSSDKQFVYAGTVLGDVKMFNLSSGEETTYQVQYSTVQYSTDHLPGDPCFLLIGFDSLLN